MGDTSTHATIAAEVIKVLQTLDPAQNYAYVELGNWLTDISQLRDPPSYASAKTVVLKEIRSSGILASLGFAELFMGADRYLEALFGAPGQDARLVQFCQELGFLATCEKFRRKAIPVSDIIRIYYGASRPPLCGSTTHSGSWTQYFPHEHLDFPPWPLDRGEPAKITAKQPRSRDAIHRCYGRAALGQRNVVACLDDQIKWLSRLLTVIEAEWSRPNLSADDKKNVLVRYGHASHAVEDYFFHSNFVELAWSLAHDGQLGNGSSIHDQRIFFRRKLMPPPVDTDDGGASPLVFTGAFGANDIYHTLIDAVRVIRLKSKITPAMDSSSLKSAAMANGLTALLDAIMPDPTKHGKEREDDQAAKLKLHRDRIANHWYVNSVRAFVRIGEFDQNSFNAFQCMLGIDKSVAEQFPKLTYAHHDEALGVVGFLQKIATRAQDAEDASKTVSDYLDGAGITEDIRNHELLKGSDKSQTEATAETLGTHSLLAKDSVNKEPLRFSSLNLATFVACQLAVIMASRVTLAPHDASKAGIDWLSALQHFLSHPAESEGPGLGWWEKLLIDSGAGQPKGLTSSLNLVTIDDGEVKRRTGEERELRSRLEGGYNDIARSFEREYQLTKASGPKMEYPMPL